MSRRDLGVGLLCGALLGAWLGWAFGPNPPRPHAPSLTRTARAADGGVPACPPTPAPAPPDPSVGAAAVLEAQDRQIRALSDAAFGRPLVWPDAELPEEVEASLEEALASCAPEVRLVETDCSEPPCLAVFHIDADTDAIVSDLCPDLPWGGHTSLRDVPCPGGSPHQVHVVRVGREQDFRDANQVEGLDYGRNLSTRSMDRSEDLFRAFACP